MSLSSSTRQRLTRAAHQRAASEASLDQAIIDAHAEGATLREIGLAAGLTAMGVQKKLQRFGLSTTGSRKP